MQCSVLARMLALLRRGLVKVKEKTRRFAHAHVPVLLSHCAGAAWQTDVLTAAHAVSFRPQVAKKDDYEYIVGLLRPTLDKHGINTPEELGFTR